MEIFKEQKSELWYLTLPIILIATAFVFADKMDVDTWMMLTGGLTGVYTVGRSAVKVSQNVKNGKNNSTYSYTMKEPDNANNI